jgi:flagellar biosynthesis/type III secretory pathway M-ring protein FliF/YscJ
MQALLLIHTLVCLEELAEEWVSKVIQMNYYAFLSFLVLALLLLYLKLSWMGLVFIVLAIIIVVYNPTKKNAKTAWEQMEKAEGSSPEKKFKEYTKSAAKQFAQGISKDQDTQEYDLKNMHKKSPAVAKSLIDTIKDLFD